MSIERVKVVASTYFEVGFGKTEEASSLLTFIYTQGVLSNRKKRILKYLEISFTGMGPR